MSYFPSLLTCVRVGYTRWVFVLIHFSKTCLIYHINDNLKSFPQPVFFLINYSSPMTCWTVPPELLLLLICIFIVSSRCVLTVFFPYSCIEVAHIWTAVAILSQTIGAFVWDPWYNLPNPCKLSFLGGKKNVKPHVIRSCWQKKLHTSDTQWTFMSGVGLAEDDVDSLATPTVNQFKCLLFM